MKLVDENGKALPIQVGHCTTNVPIGDPPVPPNWVSIATQTSHAFITPKSARAIAAELLRGASDCDGGPVDDRSIQQQQFDEVAKWLETHRDRLAALREAWIEMPFEGVVPKGWGDAIQALTNAVTDIVDPDRTLRDKPEVRRRGEIASLRSQAVYALEQVKACRVVFTQREEVVEAEWQGKYDVAVTECRERFGIDLTLPVEVTP